MRGDVLLWTSDGGLPSRLCELTTRGPYCHVSADLGDGTDIGARGEDGAQRHHVPDGRGITKVPASTLAGVTAASIEKGVRFLEGEIGTKYGWCNMANNVLALLHIPYRTASHGSTATTALRSSHAISPSLACGWAMTVRSRKVSPPTSSPARLASAN
jgi:hypothetical protein